MHTHMHACQRMYIHTALWTSTYKMAKRRSGWAPEHAGFLGANISNFDVQASAWLLELTKHSKKSLPCGAHLLSHSHEAEEGGSPLYCCASPLVWQMCVTEFFSQAGHFTMAKILELLELSDNKHVQQCQWWANHKDHFISLKILAAYLWGGHYYLFQVGKTKP